tara:strand:+ start:4315 stop:4785 length:471 start_codon:yes stop_codon:yes gene_type:complete
MPKKGIVRINQGRILPLWLRLFISGFLFVGMLYANFLMSEEIAILLTISLATPVLPIWNAYRLLEINNQAKAYLEGYWFAGFRLGPWKRFREIKEIRILKMANLHQLKRRSKGKAFGAVMIMENEDQVYLIGSNSKDKLKGWLKEIYIKLELNKSI